MGVAGGNGLVSSFAGRFSVRAPGAEDRYATALLLAFVAALCAYLTFFKNLFYDGDTGWHLAAGRHILETGSIPRTDPFSFTSAGQPWHAHEWLAEVVMAAVFNLAGWGGLTLLFAAAGGVTILLIGRELLRRLPIRWTLCGVFVVCGLLHPLALARPHMLAWPLLAVWLLILLHAREKGRAPSFAALPLMLLWANLHASYMLGLGIAAFIALEAFLTHRRDRPAMVRWGAFLAGALVAACITPHGVQGFIYPFEVSGMRVVTVIDEWRATNLEDDRLFIGVAVTLWALVGLQWRRLHPLRILLLAGLTVMALAHARHQMPFAIVASLMVAAVIAGGAREPGLRQAIPQRTLWMAAAAAAALIVAVRAAVPFTMKDNVAFPVAAISHVPPQLRAQPVLNGYSFGGPLILSGIRPYIDGRADMYGDDFTLDLVAMMRGDIERFRRADRRWRFGWTILPADVRLVSMLDREPGWRRLYADRWAVVHVRALPSAELGQSGNADN